MLTSIVAIVPLLVALSPEAAWGRACAGDGGSVSPHPAVAGTGGTARTGQDRPLGGTRVGGGAGGGHARRRVGGGQAGRRAGGRPLGRGRDRLGAPPRPARPRPERVPGGGARQRRTAARGEPGAAPGPGWGPDGDRAPPGLGPARPGRVVRAAGRARHEP